MGLLVCNRKLEVLSKPVSSSALPHSACSSCPLPLCLSVSLSLAVAGSRWACSSPSHPAAPSPLSFDSAQFLLCSLPSLIPTFVCLFTPHYSFALSTSLGPYKETRKEQASLSSVALFCLLSIAPAGFPTCPSFNLTIVSPLYFEFTHAGTLPVRRSTARSTFSPAQHWLTFQSLVCRASSKVPDLAFRSQSYPELRRELPCSLAAVACLTFACLPACTAIIPSLPSLSSPLPRLSPHR